MKKTTLSVLVTVSTIVLCLALIPTVLSQPENVTFLSYSSYYVYYFTSPYLIVVGEAQNTGPNIIDYLTVIGTFYAPDGTVYMSSSAKTVINQILPQQKTPFYITFMPYDIASDTNWTFQEVTNFTLTVSYANPTDTRQYQDLTIINDSLGIDDNGYYRVTGTVKNVGSQATNRTYVVATFYNSTGSVVAVGQTGYLTPTSIPAGDTASFTIYPIDYEMVYNKISSYSLIIQTELTAPEATPTPTPTPSASPTASPTPTPSSSTSPTPTGSGNGTATPDTYIYIAAAAIAIVAVGVVTLALRERARKNAATPQPAEQQTNTTL